MSLRSSAALPFSPRSPMNFWPSSSVACAPAPTANTMLASATTQRIHPIIVPPGQGRPGAREAGCLPGRRTQADRRRGTLHLAPRGAQWPRLRAVRRQRRASVGGFGMPRAAQRLDDRLGGLRARQAIAAVDDEERHTVDAERRGALLGVRDLADADVGRQERICGVGVEARLVRDLGEDLVRADEAPVDEVRTEQALDQRLGVAASLRPRDQAVRGSRVGLALDALEVERDAGLRAGAAHALVDLGGARGTAELALEVLAPVDALAGQVRVELVGMPLDD